MSYRPRVLLSNEEARDIFKLQPTHGFPSLHAASVDIAKRYGVSPKAIRDIWTGRSWLNATFSLWNADERPARKAIGRPKGRKDSKPRKSKSDGQLSLGSQDASNCPIWGTPEINLLHSRPGESVTSLPVSTLLARSSHMDVLLGSACAQHAIPIELQTPIFQPIPGIFGVPSFNPPAGLISANALHNCLFGVPYTPAYLRMPHTPLLRTGAEYAYGGGWGIDTALAVHLWQSTLQIRYPSNQYFNASAGSCNAFRPS